MSNFLDELWGEFSGAHTIKKGRTGIDALAANPKYKALQIQAMNDQTGLVMDTKDPQLAYALENIQTAANQEIMRNDKAIDMAHQSKNTIGGGEELAQHLEARNKASENVIKSVGGEAGKAAERKMSGLEGVARGWGNVSGQQFGEDAKKLELSQGLENHIADSKAKALGFFINGGTEGASAYAASGNNNGSNAASGNNNGSNKYMVNTPSEKGVSFTNHGDSSGADGAYGVKADNENDDFWARS